MSYTGAFVASVSTPLKLLTTLRELDRFNFTVFTDPEFLYNYGKGIANVNQTIQQKQLLQKAGLKFNFTHSTIVYRSFGTAERKFWTSLQREDWHGREGSKPEGKICCSLPAGQFFRCRLRSWKYFCSEALWVGCHPHGTSLPSAWEYVHEERLAFEGNFYAKVGQKEFNYDVPKF